LETIGYHTVEDRNNPEDIRNNAPFIGTRPNQWLSRGCYFWDDDLEQAHTWGKPYKGGYVICEAELSLNNVLDLHNKRSHQEQFKKMLEMVMNFLKLQKISNVPIGKAIEFLRKKNEKQAGVFPYFGIRASDFPYQDKFIFVEGKKEYTMFNPRIQICIFSKDTNNISNTKIIYPENYKSS
jgi:hypothetical protein